MWFLISITLLLRIFDSSCSIEQIRIRENNNVTLTCQFRWENSVNLENNESSLHSEQVILWYKDEFQVIAVNTISNDPNKYSIVQLNERTFQLIIFNVQLESSAIYKCQNFTVKEEHRFQLIVTAPPSDLELHSTPHLLIANRGVTLFNCSTARVYPLPTFEWYKDDQLVQRSLGNRTSSNSLFSWSILTVFLNHLDHNQTLRCQVSNEILPRPAVLETKLDVLFAPMIDFFVNDQLVNDSWQLVENEAPAIVHCRLSSNPSALSTIEWLKNDQLLIDQRRSQLTIHWSSEKLVDRITCRANNSLGRTEKTIRIENLYKPKLSMIEEQTLNENERLILECSINSNPSCQRIVWLQNNRELSNEPCPLTNETSIVVQFQIENISPSQMGNYTCQVTNSLGRQFQAVSKISTEVRVRYRPIIVNKGSKFAIDERDQTEIICLVDSHPRSEVIWFGPSNERLENYAHRQMVNETFISSKLYVGRSNLGFYRCLARNELGEIQTVFEVRAASVPDPINEVEVKNVTDSSFEIEVKRFFDGGAAQSFFFEIENNETKIKRETKANSVVFRDLKDETSYKIEIRTSNRFGFNPNRTTIFVRTKKINFNSLKIPKIQQIFFLHGKKLKFRFRIESNEIEQFCFQHFDEIQNEIISPCFPMENLRVEKNLFQIEMENSNRKFQICFRNSTEICSRPTSFPSKKSSFDSSNEWLWILIGTIAGLSLIFILLTFWILAEFRRRKGKTKKSSRELSSISVRVRDSNLDSNGFPSSELSPYYYQNHRPFAYAISEKKNSFILDSGVPSSTSNHSETSTSNVLSSSDLDERSEGDGFLDKNLYQLRLPVIERRSSSITDVESGFSTPTNSNQTKRFVFQVVV